MQRPLILTLLVSSLLMACDNNQDTTTQGGIPEISEKKRATIEARPDPEQASREEASRAADAEERAKREARQRGN